MSTVAPPARLAWIPRGVPLDAVSFTSRHRLLVGVLGLHLLVLSVWAAVTGAGDLVTVGGLVFVALTLTVALAARSLVARAGAVALGLMEGAGIAVMVSGGLTDVHIWFYVLLAMVALYQSWVPFLLAVAFVAVHHVGMSLTMPEMIFSSPAARAHPIAFSLLHAGFLLVEGAALAYGWKVTEDAEARRAHEAGKAEAQRAEQLEVERELAEARASAATAAASEAMARQERAEELKQRLADLRSAGSRLDRCVEGATGTSPGLRVSGSPSSRSPRRPPRPPPPRAAPATGPRRAPPPWSASAPRRGRSTRSREPSPASPTRPTSSRSTPPSSPPAPGRPASGLRSSPVR